MFLHTLPFASIFPLILFVERIFHSFSHSSHDYSTSQIGFFWDYYGDYSSVSFLGDAFFVAFIAFVTAVLIFNFAWSKKQCNVVLSLGMKRSDVYLAKLLAGIVPFIAAVILSAGFEVFACAACGYKISLRYLTIVIKVIFDCIAPYIFSFSVFSLVLANVGSIIEGAVFSYLFITIPNAISNIANEFFNAYTLGSPVNEVSDVAVWNWSDPLWCAGDEPFFDSYSYTEYGDGDIFSIHSTFTYDIFAWSGVIMCFVYAAIAIAAGIYAYKHKKNEIAGTFGRARALTEISAVLAALTGFYFFDDNALSGAFNAPAEPHPLRFIYGCLAFIVVYIVFKMIFGYKRKKEFIGSLKGIPAYIGSLVTCVLVFYFGFFGYSSRIPSIEDIECVEVSTSMFAYLDDELSDNTYFVMKYMNIRDELTPTMTYNDEIYYRDYVDIDYGSLNYCNPHTAYFKTESDIKKAVQVHQSFIDAGRVSDSGKDTYGTKIRFTYILKNGREITRDYHRADEETIKKILLLSDCNAVKDIQNLNWAYSSAEETLAKSYYDEMQQFQYDKFDALYVMDCYLFSKDMKRGFNIGKAERELLNAIAEDIRTQSANAYFYHSPEDEIGVISFGLSKQHKYFSKNESELIDYRDHELESATWNLNSTDIKAVVLTKDMTNTIKYLEDSGYMHYFDRKSTAEDIAYVKVENMRTLYGQRNAYKNIPIFYGAYTRKKPVYLWDQSEVPEYSYDDYDTSFSGYADSNPFTKVTPVEDKAQIQALLDDSMLFGFCSNDCYIMNIYYNDDTSGTVFIPAGSPSLQNLAN
jgi:ABC-type transport system involved in multi-copper enzyme maturation permease subunit/phage pi2 protein 07